MAEENYASSNPDLKGQQRFVQSSQFSLNPIINHSVSQNLSQNVCSNVSANKSQNEQNQQIKTNQSQKQNETSPKNQKESIFSRQLNKQREPSFLQSKEPISGVLKHSQTFNFVQQNLSNSIYNKLKGFFISIYTKKFVNILKQSSSLLRFKQMELQQFNIISDQASDYYYYYYQNRLNVQINVQITFDKKTALSSVSFDLSKKYFDVISLFQCQFIFKKHSHRSYRDQRINQTVNLNYYNLSTQRKHSEKFYFVKL